MFRCAGVYLLLSVIVVCSSTRYEPTWKSLDSRPLPSWYDDAKFGIFIHWGVFSVPSFGNEWFWHSWKTGSKAIVDFMKRNYPPNFTYADFASQFTAELYDPDHWADVFKASGAKYVVLTSKHHEGFCNWPTNVSFNWNAQQVGPKRDLVGDLANAIRKRTNLHFGLYHSLFEWYNPLYLQDHKNAFKTRYFVDGKTMPELYELVNAYKPDVLWSDGDAGPVDYWNSTGFLAWLYNDSPVKDTVVTNDRWGTGTSCKHGGYYTCHDRYNPGTKQNHKWENCMTIDAGSWGYRRNANLASYLSVHQLIETLAETVSCGGNLLMNVGPTHDGRIMPVFEERLRQMGEWMTVNGEAIYASSPWTHQNDSLTKQVWYTSKKTSDGRTAVYCIMLVWPANDALKLASAPPETGLTVTMLGYPDLVKWSPLAGTAGIQLQMPTISAAKMPSRWAWVFKLVYRET